MDEFALHNGDCLEIMKEIGDKSIDFILCDLPYGTTNSKWDSIIPLEPLWEQYERIIKDDGAIALFSQQPFTSILCCSNLKLFRYEWIWEKEYGTGFLNANKMPMKAHENILIFYKKLPTYNPIMRTVIEPQHKYRKTSEMQKRNTEKSIYGKTGITMIVENDAGTMKRFPVDILNYRKERENVHPSQKPLKLCEYFIKTYTNAGDLVLDNCMGSGTTGIACAYNGRKFIGIEKDEHYFRVANDRVTMAYKERIPDELFES